MRMIGVLGIITLLFLASCTTQHGTSKDRIYGYDTGPVWGHMYLVNDHSTTYCFDKTREDIIKEAYDSNRTVMITYEKGPLKAFFCMGQAEQETVVVTQVKT